MTLSYGIDRFLNLQMSDQDRTDGPLAIVRQLNFIDGYTLLELIGYEEIEKPLLDLISDVAIVDFYEPYLTRNFYDWHYPNSRPIFRLNSNTDLSRVTKIRL